MKLAVLPPDDNSIFRVTTTHEGEWTLYARDAQGEPFEETRRLRQEVVAEIYRAGESVISEFQLLDQPLLSENDIENLVTNTCSIEVTLRIGAQRIMVDSGPINKLTERPHMRKLVYLVGSQLPKKLNIKLPE